MGLEIRYISGKQHCAEKVTVCVCVCGPTLQLQSPTGTIQNKWFYSVLI